MFSQFVPARALAGVALAAALAATLMSGCGGDEAVSKRPARNCPVAASEVSKELGLELRAIGPKGSTKVSCSFRPKADCPCGPMKYSAVDIDVTGGMTKRVITQRDAYLLGKGVPPNEDPFKERPDLGKDAYTVKPEATRGKYATFPSSYGPTTVNATFGGQDASNRDWREQDKQAADRVIGLVAKRMS